MTDFVKLVVYVPQKDAEKVRTVMGEAGAGKVGKYQYCSFSVVGTGRFLPGKGAHPAIGRVGQLEEVVEERIETVCTKKILARVIKAIKQVHPYERVALDVYPLLNNPSRTAITY